MLIIRANTSFLWNFLPNAHGWKPKAQSLDNTYKISLYQTLRKLHGYLFESGETHEYYTLIIYLVSIILYLLQYRIAFVEQTLSSIMSQDYLSREFWYDIRVPMMLVACKDFCVKQYASFFKSLIIPKT